MPDVGRRTNLQSVVIEDVQITGTADAIPDATVDTVHVNSLIANGALTLDTKWATIFRMKVHGQFYFKGSSKMSAAGKVSRPSSGIFQSPCFPLHVQTSIPSTGTCPALSHTRDDEAINSASVIRSPVATNLPMTNCLPSAEFNTSASPIIEGTPPLVLPVDNIPLYDTGAQPSPHNSSSPSLENESHSSTLLAEVEMPVTSTACESAL
ncbi:hypothetical protein V6N11_081904 [Hibiscus sabdariffa]|uniref:Uncharacterized protein n=1 Tax=Hibiscus sabdariffa TaxID=183260 RepID=A0ABR2Q7I6_9ROSI